MAPRSEGSPHATALEAFLDTLAGSRTLVQQEAPAGTGSTVSSATAGPGASSQLSAGPPPQQPPVVDCEHVRGPTRRGSVAACWECLLLTRQRTPEPREGPGQEHAGDSEALDSLAGERWDGRGRTGLPDPAHRPREHSPASDCSSCSPPSASMPDPPRGSPKAPSPSHAQPIAVPPRGHPGTPPPGSNSYRGAAAPGTPPRKWVFDGVVKQGKPAALPDLRGFWSGQGKGD